HSFTQLIKMETFYAYLNPRVDQQRLAKNDVKSIHWTNLMKTSIFNCSLCEEEFDFILKPIIAKVKLIFNKSKELRVPKLLVDCVLQDTAIEVSQSQYISILRIIDSFMRIEVNRKYMKYKTTSLYTNLNRKEKIYSLWKFAYNCILNEYIRPYSWSIIQSHRVNYRKYKSLYKQRLLYPSDSELKVDLQKAEDSLDICNILIAQEDAKLEISKEQPSFVETATDTVDSGTNIFNSWWTNWLGFGFMRNKHRVPLIEIKSEKENLWSKFTNEEKEKVNEMMQSFGETSPNQEANIDMDKYIAHKINITLANMSLSLINGTHNGDKKEILVASLNHFLASFETRPSANGFKLSVRAETFIVEGVAGGSSHYEIIPIVTADKSITSSLNVNSNSNTTHKTHVFGIDVEKNPLNVKANYSITGQVEPIEILYQHQSYNEVMRFFFDVPLFDALAKKKEVRAMLKDTIERTSRLSKRRLVEIIFEKQSHIYWNVDLKSPYFVVPEFGAIERSGRVLVIDFGRLLIKSDLQQESAVFDKTNATASEMEEKLYDRISVTLSDVQILFSDAGDEWRVAKELPESDVHLMPRLHIHLVCSRSLRPDYIMAPKYKLNVIVAAFKFNLSDRRIRLLSDFILKAPLPMSTQSGDKTDSPGSDIVAKNQSFFDLDSQWIQKELNAKELNDIRITLSAMPISVEEADDSQCASHPSSVDAVVDTLSVSQKTPNNEDDEYYSASDVSEFDDSELVSWVRNIDLPGFEDNVSPNNVISVMIRFTIGEVLVQLSRSSDVCDKPYLMLRLEKLNVDLSLMTYGQALQASLRRIQLVDKQQSSSTGGYLELLNSTSENEMITVLYRKVKATCPDFKSHFHQVEHSLIIDLNALSVTFHRESLITMARFITYVIDSIPMQLLTGIKSHVNSIIPESTTSLILVRKQSDPPIPSGATKFSISTRFSRIDINLCETELNFAKLEICGFEFDYIQKANEKYIIRLDLSQLNIFDESEDTLYQKIFYMENDEKIFDFKYVRKSSQVISEEVELNEKDEKKSRETDTCDGSLRLRIGHIRFVLLLKFMVNFYHFLMPFMHPSNFRNSLKKTATKNIQESVDRVAERKLRLQLNINIKSPTILIPQKANSPNVVICNFGDLTIENFSRI
ncbi:vacuolar protein sorting-associated protein 13A-like isoform X8, partial [Leptotrombidium deliense]